MAQSSFKRRKLTTEDELMQLDKEQLVATIIKYQKHNVQLKNIIRRNNSEDDIVKRKKPFDFTKCHYRRILLHIMYFGWSYNGFVVQEDTTMTIESLLFQALTTTCLIESREKAQYHRCGRTDKGVSALGQVVSLSIRSKYPPEEQYTPEAISSELPYCSMLTRMMPPDIIAIAWMPIPADKPDYSARFNCQKRQYKYYFPRSGLDIAAMRHACARLLGAHDFRNLCKMDVANGVVEFIRTIHKAEILPVNGKESDECTAMYYLLIESNAFLWHQIRCIMGILLLVGEGKERPDVITDLLDTEKVTRRPQYNMAIDVPLNLNHCVYDIEENNNWVYVKAHVRYVIARLQKAWTVYNTQSTIYKESVDQLEGIYAKLLKETGAKDESEQNTVMEYTKGLFQGIQPKVYKSLLERPTCRSLEERIKLHKRKWPSIAKKPISEENKIEQLDI